MTEFTHPSSNTQQGKPLLEGWEKRCLGDHLVGKPKNGYSAREVDHLTGTSVLGLGCLTPDGFKPNHLKQVLPSPRSNAALLHDGDLLITRSNTRELVGLAGVFKDTGSPTTYPDLMMRLTPAGTTSGRYLEALLRSPELRRQIQALATGTSGSMVKISSSIVQGLEVVVPPLPEQARITEVLDTLDEAIRGAEATISKQQSLQVGLLLSLVAPQVPPHNWSNSTLGDAADWVSGGTPTKSYQPYWGGEVPWVSPKDMKVFLLGDTQDHLTALGAQHGTRIVPSHSVLVVVRGMILAHTFPVCLTQCEIAINQDVKAVVARPGVSGQFLGYWFRAHAERLLRLVTEATHGTKKIDLEDLKKFPINLPPKEEQERIAAILSTADDSLTGEIANLRRLQALKSGLTSDLLTGRVRINGKK